MLPLPPYIAVLLLVHLSHQAPPSRYVVTTPYVEYRIQTGPLPVEYTASPARDDLSIRLREDIDGSLVTRAQLAVPETTTSGRVQFDCGIINTPGRYVIQLTNSSNSLLGSTTFTATLPEFRLSLPSSHTAQENIEPELTTRFIGQKVACRDSGPVRYWLEVLYSEDHLFTSAGVIHKEENLALRRLNSASISFNCAIFDRAGFVRVELHSSITEGSLSTSNAMEVSWGDYYRVWSTQTSVLPCTGQLVLQYSRPDCVVRDDNIHMYAMKSSSELAEREMEYLYEAPAQVDHSSAAFSCEDVNIYQWNNHPMAYCFRYQSVAANSAVTDHQLYCIPSNASEGLRIDGGWSSWADWSVCNSHCGWGRQSRYRYCNNPSPANGGSFCGGDLVEWRECQADCLTAAPSPTVLPVTQPRPANRIPDCWCGCTLNHPAGVIIPGRSCRTGVSDEELIVWIIQAPENLLIQLNVTDFQWTLAGQVLKIRDGDSITAEMLSNLRGDRDKQPITLTSSSNALHLQFTSLQKLPLTPDIFYAVYTFTDLSTTPLPLDLVKRSGEPVWKLPVIISGAIGGFLLVVIIIGVCSYKRISQASQSPKINKTKSMLDQTIGSPNHVAIQVQDGEYTNFGDVTIAPSVQTNKTPTDGVPKSQQSDGRRLGDRLAERGPPKRTKRLKKLVKVQELPDPYHVRPEDFVHSVDVLHIPSAEETITARLPHRKHNKMESRRHKRHKRRRHVERREAREADRLINSLPVGSDHRSYPADVDGWPTVDLDISILDDDEYRALINQLSATSGSADPNEVVNTSAEIHIVPHTTPVDSITQELSSPMPSSGGHRSPYLDDGYNSLANTGSTQSNLSSRVRDHAALPRLTLIKERSAYSEASQETPKSTSSRPDCRNGRCNDHSRLTCPLSRPDGASDGESQGFDDTQASSLGVQTSLTGTELPPPPEIFSDELTKSRLLETSRGNNSSMNSSWPAPPDEISPFLY